MITKIVMLVNTHKKEAVSVAKKLLASAGKIGVEFLLPEEEAGAVGEAAASKEAVLKQAKFAVVLGGDGTFLRAARMLLGHRIPIYGINTGRLGFLAIGNPEDAEKDIKLLLEEKYTTQPRDVLKVKVWRDGRIVHECFALNDIVISRSSLRRVIELEVLVGSDVLSVFLADGIILSTPTGSTAYALSAGGPIIPPHVSCLLLAPICAHTLYARPIVLHEKDRTFIRAKEENSRLVLTQDGQLDYALEPGDCVEATIDDKVKVYTVKVEGKNYYDLLRKKLSWGLNGPLGEGND